MLTPLIADELKEAVKQYPESWLQEAIKEAVAQKQTPIRRYISRILEPLVYRKVKIMEHIGDILKQIQIRTNTSKENTDTWSNDEPVRASKGDKDL